MKLKISCNKINARNDGYNISRLIPRMVNTFCGIIQYIASFSRSKFYPRFFCIGAMLSGIHVLRGENEAGSYHIGGGGLFFSETMIKVLAESLERYAQILAEQLLFKKEIKYTNYDQLILQSKYIISSNKLQYFTPKQINQFKNSNILLSSFNSQSQIGWIKCLSLTDQGNNYWCPAQFILVGYQIKTNEPFLLPGVTTGTAAHTCYLSALKNAILELIQLDSVMGHWYGKSTVKKIVYNDNYFITKIINKYCYKNGPKLEFFLLPNPDLIGHTVACIYKDDNGIPARAIGISCDLSIESAMYKSMLEGLGVAQIAQHNLLKELKLNPKLKFHDKNMLFNLDKNIALYALPESREILDKKFSSAEDIDIKNIKPPSKCSIEDEVNLLITSFKNGNKNLLFKDLTTVDIKDLGFYVLRVWSPDTLSLSLPDAPPLAHSRFLKYGGIGDVYPHPYP